MLHGQVACELVITCSPVGAVEPRVVEDAVMAGVRAGDDRRVVRERDGGQRRHRAVTERDAHLDEARDVRCFAPRAHVVEDVGVRAVEQERDHVARALRRVEHVEERLAVLDRDVVCRRRAARSRGARRSSGRCRRGGRRAGSRRATSRPCRRSPSARAPARSRSSRARRGGRPGLPSCARPSGSRRGRARRASRRAARSARRRTGRRWRRGAGAGAPRSASRPDELVGRLVGERVAARRGPPRRSRRVSVRSKVTRPVAARAS